jgi:hypothetical protein
VCGEEECGQEGQGDVGVVEGVGVVVSAALTHTEEELSKQ